MQEPGQEGGPDPDELLQHGPLEGILLQHLQQREGTCQLGAHLAIHGLVHGLKQNEGAKVWHALAQI